MPERTASDYYREMWAPRSHVGETFRVGEWAAVERVGTTAAGRYDGPRSIRIECASPGMLAAIMAATDKIISEGTAPGHVSAQPGEGGGQ